MTLLERLDAESDWTIAGLAAAEIRQQAALIDRLTRERDLALEALKWIEALHYQGRETFHAGNAYNVARAMNATLLDIFDRAHAVITEINSK